MVDLDRGKIIQGGKEETIRKFEVWFMTPFGIATSYPEMISYMREKEVPVLFTVTPLAVAVGDSLNEILLGTNK